MYSGSNELQLDLQNTHYAMFLFQTPAIQSIVDIHAPLKLIAPPLHSNSQLVYTSERKIISRESIAEPLHRKSIALITAPHQ